MSYGHFHRLSADKIFTNWLGTHSFTNCPRAIIGHTPKVNLQLLCRSTFVQFKGLLCHKWQTKRAWIIVWGKNIKNYFCFLPKTIWFKPLWPTFELQSNTNQTSHSCFSEQFLITIYVVIQPDVHQLHSMRSKLKNVKFGLTLLSLPTELVNITAG